VVSAVIQARAAAEGREQHDEIGNSLTKVPFQVAGTL
jgi:hypothetical protein